MTPDQFFAAPTRLLVSTRGLARQVVLTKIMTSKEKTNAFAVIQGILSESGPAGFYSGIQVRSVSIKS